MFIQMGLRCCVCFVAFVLSSVGAAKVLEVRSTSDGRPYIVYDGKAAFGYGPSPQHILTYLPQGQGNSYLDWIRWAESYQISHVRSYPPSSIVEPPAKNLFHRIDAGNNKFDLNQFNEEYFAELGRACKALQESGIFVHLQLWQAVAWKKNWDRLYYNPENNVNPDISLHAGPGEFASSKNAVLLQHQKQYVRKILDATGKIGNVFYDIMNEIGNGTGTDEEWVMEIVDTIEKWETENETNVLITINDEGGLRLKNPRKVDERMDLIVRDLGRYDEHIRSQQELTKPTISVRNIDWNYEQNTRRYFYGAENLEINRSENLQVRGRKYWWRMYMAKVQMAGGYADAYNEVLTVPGGRTLKRLFEAVGLKEYFPWGMKSSYDLNAVAEKNYLHFANFIPRITDYQSLMPYDDIVSDHPAAHDYCLQSENTVLIYLESPNGEAGFSYPERQTTLQSLSLPDGFYQGIFYYPGSGDEVKFDLEVRESRANILIPRFLDDLVIFIE